MAAEPPDAGLPRRDAFERSTGTAFRVPEAQDGPTELTLVSVDGADRRPGWESFSLLFAGPANPLPQGTYLVGHDTLGSFPLFLVPVASEDGGPRYEAVFNRQTS